MNNNKLMTLERLGTLLDAYGGDLRRWPEPARSTAEALIARDGAARQLFNQALALDALLDEASAPAPSHALKARLIVRARPALWRQGFGALWPFGPAWQPAAAFALIAALGISLGVTVGPADIAASASDDVDVLGLYDTFDDEDLS
ncbi:MAG: hypothetical protein EXQ98_03025 [Alphaproteobacteria bacterium]|nr:hypothetical protein [Alphaproteobacteria bacterium]